MKAPSDAPPDAELLADLVEAVEAGEAPTQAALEEVVVLAERIASVATLLRRRPALRRLRELLAGGEYPSVRQASEKLAREMGGEVSAETIRWWASLGGSPPVPTHHEATDDGGQRRTTTT